MSDEAPVLTCRGLRKRFGDLEAVRDVSFDIARSETYGLLGPNGAGKTTTISMICGLLRRDAGEVLVAGRQVDTSSVAAKAAIGYVPQDIAIYPDLTARENLTFFARLYGLDAATRASRVSEVLDVVGLTERAGDRADEFSGGMKRRLNIGIGLLHQPQLLILDEPTVGVDPQSRNAILESVERLSAAGMGVLYTTHYMEEAERLCDRVGIIDEGELKAEGTRRDLVSLVGQHDTIRLTVATSSADAITSAQQVDGVASVSAADHTLDLLVDDARAMLPSLLERLGGDGVAITSVEIIEPDLEAVFLHLTGKALRD